MTIEQSQKDYLNARVLALETEVKRLNKKVKKLQKKQLCQTLKQ